MQREQAIVQAAAQIRAEHDRWEDGPPDQTITQRFADTIEASLEIILFGGDIPQNCISLWQACAALLDKWAEVNAGRLVDEKGRPLEPFWAAMRAVFAEVEQAETPATKQIEPVHILYEQLKDFGLRDQQIARMYGQRNDAGQWEGVFFRNGVPQAGLIQQEAEKPGSVITDDWVHPDEQQRKKRQLLAAQTKLAELQRARPPVKHEDPASVEELLREGQFPDVIAKVKGTTEQSVRDEAARLGIEPNERDSWATGLHDVKRPENTLSRIPDTPEPFDDEPSEPETDEADDKIAAVLEIYGKDRRLGAAEVAKRAKRAGIKVGVKEVGEILREAKQKKAAAAAG